MPGIRNLKHYRDGRSLEFFDFNDGSCCIFSKKNRIQLIKTVKSIPVSSSHLSRQQTGRKWMPSCSFLSFNSKKEKRGKKLGNDNALPMPVVFLFVDDGNVVVARYTIVRVPIWPLTRQQ